MADILLLTLAVHHGHRRAYSGESLDQPSAPINAGYRGKAVSGDLTIGDLAGDEQWPINHRALLCVTDVWG